jgi:hypothetical protein
MVRNFGRVDDDLESQIREGQVFPFQVVGADIGYALWVEEAAVRSKTFEDDVFEREVLLCGEITVSSV